MRLLRLHLIRNSLLPLSIVIRKRDTLVTRAVVHCPIVLCHCSPLWLVPILLSRTAFSNVSKWGLRDILKMTGENCSIFGCNSSNRIEFAGTSLFRVTKGKDPFGTQWREKLIAVITKHRVVDEKLKDRIHKVNLFIYEKHFESSNIEQCKCLPSCLFAAFVGR